MKNRGEVFGSRGALVTDDGSASGLTARGACAHGKSSREIRTSPCNIHVRVYTFHTERVF